MRRLIAQIPIAALGLALASPAAAAAEATPARDFSDVEVIFTKHCLDCHASQDPEGNLVLESFESLMKGGESGAAVSPGTSADSLLVKMIEGRIEKNGKKKIMPPGKRTKLNPDEIETIKRWIDSGAKPPPDGKALVKQLVVPKIATKGAPRKPVNALAYAPAPKLIAVARYGEVELRSASTHAIVRTLGGHRGNVTALVFSSDGKELFAAAGEAGLLGEVRQWKIADGTLVRTFEGHKDALYSVALSPDGKTLATGSYDQKIKLWDVQTGAELKTLSGHNGCVFDLAFRPDGKILASASADRTVKLWDTATGDRRDTLSQSLKELYTVAFSRDGRKLLAGGVDNRIRIWEISDSAAETTNPLLDARFAHEGAILNLVFSADGKTLLSSADDRTVKVWDAVELKEKFPVERQPDWPPALTFASDDKTIVVGRLDGSLGFYATTNGQPLPPPKPELTRCEPRGIRRGTTAQLRLSGTNLTTLTEVKFSNPAIAAEIVRSATHETGEAFIEVTAPADLPRGPYEFSVANPGGQSGKLQLHVDDLPQAYEATTNAAAGVYVVSARTALPLPVRNERGEGRGEGKSAADIPAHLLSRRPPSPQSSPPSAGGEREDAGTMKPYASGPAFVTLPVSFWGAFDPKGDIDQIEFEAKAGQSIVFDVAAARLGSKATASLTLFDSQGVLLASDRGFDGSDPLLTFKPRASGRYRIEVSDVLLGSSRDHFYRLSIGTFAEVVAFFPLSVPAQTETDVELIGYNLPVKSAVHLKAGKPGEIDLPVDPEKFRSRRPFKVLVTDTPELLEAEPNDTPAEATPIHPPCAVAGRITTKLGQASRLPRAGETPTLLSDIDLFRFEARQGQTWIIETAAAQRGSPLDTKIEVLHADGRPVPRLLLQAVRNSAITFRPIDSITPDCRVENWEEMELNQLLYLQGEVVKLFRAPQGPDSGFVFYTSAGKRRAYFDTSATAHALDEPCYIVEPHPPDAKLVANGLPVFPIYYANDDDGERKLGSDSRLHFTVPADGAYLLRVTDTRGYGGDRFVYRLVVREARPDFKVTLNGANPAVNAGSGQAFSVSAERFDGFDGEIKVDISGLPPGFSVSTPLVIQAGQTEARGAIHAEPDAPPPNDTNAAISIVTASAVIYDQPVTREVNNLGKIKLADKPKLYVFLEPYTDSTSTNPVAVDPARPLELTIAPGQTIPAWLKIKRAGHDDLVTFTVENLPHGVIVDNIGLNGVLIAKSDQERQIFLNAAKWVPDTDRLCYAIENQAGKQTSLPVLLHVRRPVLHDAASVR